MKDCLSLHEQVERKLLALSQFSEEKRSAVFEAAGSSSWVLGLHERFVVESSRAPYDESELLPLDFTLPDDYRFYLTQIAKGGLASEFGIAPLDFSDEFVVHNFREFKTYKVSDFRDDDDDVYLKQFYDARGVVLGIEDHNAHEVFLVCEGYLSGSVWLFDNNREIFKPLHRSFEEHLLRHLSRLEGLLVAVSD